MNARTVPRSREISEEVDRGPTRDAFGILVALAIAMGVLAWHTLARGDGAHHPQFAGGEQRAAVVAAAVSGQHAWGPLQHGGSAVPPAGSADFTYYLVASPAQADAVYAGLGTAAGTPPYVAVLVAGTAEEAAQAANIIADDGYLRLANGLAAARVVDLRAARSFPAADGAFLPFAEELSYYLVGSPDDALRLETGLYEADTQGVLLGKPPPNHAVAVVITPDDEARTRQAIDELDALRIAAGQASVTVVDLRSR